jgi:hypothetical protein
MASAIRCLQARLDHSLAGRAVISVPAECADALADLALAILLSNGWVQAQLTPEQWERARSDPPDVFEQAESARAFLASQLERYTLEALFEKEGVTAGVR